MATPPIGFEPYVAPIEESLYTQLTLILFLVGFFMFSWLLIYQISYSKARRSLLKEILIAISISILWGLSAQFGMLSVGIYL